MTKLTLDSEPDWSLFAELRSFDIEVLPCGLGVPEPHPDPSVTKAWWRIHVLTVWLSSGKADASQIAEAVKEWERLKQAYDTRMAGQPAGP